MNIAVPTPLSAAKEGAMAVKGVYSTQEIADLVGVTKRCILNWLRDGKIPEPDRDRNQYRIWTQRELSQVLAYKGQRLKPQKWG